MNALLAFLIKAHRSRRMNCCRVYESLHYVMNHISGITSTLYNLTRRETKNKPSSSEK